MATAQPSHCFRCCRGAVVCSSAKSCLAATATMATVVFGKVLVHRRTGEIVQHVPRPGQFAQPFAHRDITREALFERASFLGRQLAVQVKRSIARRADQPAVRFRSWPWYSSSFRVSQSQEIYSRGVFIPRSRRSAFQIRFQRCAQVSSRAVSSDLIALGVSSIVSAISS